MEMFTNIGIVVVAWGFAIFTLFFSPYKDSSKPKSWSNLSIWKASIILWLLLSGLFLGILEEVRQVNAQRESNIKIAEQDGEITKSSSALIQEAMNLLAQANASLCEGIDCLSPIPPLIPGGGTGPSFLSSSLTASNSLLRAEAALETAEAAINAIDDKETRLELLRQIFDLEDQAASLRENIRAPVPPMNFDIRPDFGGIER